MSRKANIHITQISIIAGLFGATYLNAQNSDNFVVQENRNIRQLSRLYNYWDTPYNLVIEDGYLYAATGLSGLQIVDIADPLEPEVVGWCDEVELSPTEDIIEFRYIIGMLKVDDFLFTAERNGLSVFDISRPQRPRLIANLPQFDRAADLTRAGNFIYMPDGENGVAVIDISDPFRPVIVRRIPIPEFARRTCIEGERLFILNFPIHNPDWGLFAFDISTPQSPELISEHQIQIIEMAVVGNNLYAVCSDSFRIIDISNIDTLRYLSAIYLPDARNISISNNRAFFTESDSLFTVYDVSNPSEPRLLTQLDLPVRVTFDFKVEENYAYITTWNLNILLCDISRIFEPRIIGNILEPYVTWDVYSDGRYAFILDDKIKKWEIAFARDYHTQAIFVQNPEHPVEMGSFSVNGKLCAYYEGYLYCAAGNAGMKVYNVTRPWQPREVGVPYTHSCVTDIACEGDYAYLAVAEMDTFPFRAPGLQVYNISAPNRRSEVGFVDLPRRENYPYEVAVSENVAYLLTYSDNRTVLCVFDVSNQSQPRQIATIAGLGLLYPHITVGNDKFYLWNWNGNQVCIYDSRNPQQPVLVNTYHPPGLIEGLAANGNNIVLSLGRRGITVLDVSIPSQPIEVGNFNTPGSALQTAVSGNYAYIADLTNFSIYDISDALSAFNIREPFYPERLTIQVRPNPFNSRTLLSFDLYEPGFIRLTLNDYLGRRQQSIFAGNLPAGTFKHFINCTDLPAGLFYISLFRSDIRTITAPVVLIK